MHIFLPARSRRTGTAGLPESIGSSAPNGVLRVLVARGFLNRALGLLTRADLPADEGQFFARCSAIHTFFMRFPIDVLFLDAHGAIIALHERVAPWRILHRTGSTGVLELAAGTACRAGFRVGDLLPELASRGDRS